LISKEERKKMEHEKKKKKKKKKNEKKKKKKKKRKVNRWESLNLSKDWKSLLIIMDVEITVEK